MVGEDGGHETYKPEPAAVDHETAAFGDAGVQGDPGAYQRPGATVRVRWRVAMRPGLRSALVANNSAVDAWIDRVDRIKANVRAKVQHPFGMIQRPFSHVKMHYRGLAKHATQLKTLFARSHLCVVRKVLTA